MASPQPSEVLEKRPKGFDVGYAESDYSSSERTSQSSGLSSLPRDSQYASLFGLHWFEWLLSSGPVMYTSHLLLTWKGWSDGPN
jgi:hypothetical protein